MNVRIGIAAIVVMVLAFSALKSTVNRSSGVSIVRARLTDVRALPVGAPVTLAGLPVGTIVKRRVGSGYAEIDIEFGSKIDLRKDATLFKRRISLLSGPSLEIDPGDSEEKLPTNYIERVVETSPIGDVLYEISEALPGVQQASEEGMLQAEQLRAQVNGPFQDTIKSFDKSAEDIASRMHNRLEKMNSALERGEKVHFEPRAAIEPVFDRAEELTTKAQDSIGRADEWVVRTASQTREKVENTRIDWSDFSDPVTDIDKGQGTLGTLLNSGEVHDDIVQITNDTRAFVDAVANWNTTVGLKTEFALNGRGPTGYVTLKAGRANRFYYMELVGSSRGTAPSAAIEYDDARDSWTREIQIKDELRFTFQYATKLGPAIVRYGFKESTFGAGTDLSLIDNRLELSADVFEVGVNDLPRVKLAASLKVFGQLYMLAGLDDVLNAGQTIDTSGANGTENLSQVYLGRDVFFGAGLQFSDRDLSMLMRIGSTALGALLL